MVLIYILSILSLSSLFIEKTQPIQINQVEENNMIKVKTVKSKDVKISNQVNSWTDENNTSSNTDLENLNTENNEDEYEEIIFHDDFDKEYRNDVENAYLDQ